jgi:superfamily II DNA or RNA helicase
VCNVLPTGAGKTVIFCAIAESAAKKNNSVLILVHRQELLIQTSEHLTRLGVEHGLIAPGHSMTGDLVQVASVHTIVRRLDRIVKPSLIIIDECHHAGAQTWKTIIDYCHGSYILGVTATPCRLDGKGLGVFAGGYFEIMIEGPNISDLIYRGYLAPPITYAPSDIDLTGVHLRGGDYDQHEINTRVDKPKITGNAIDHYIKLSRGLPAIAFCASIKHADHVATEFSIAGVKAASLTGKMSDYERKNKIKGLANGAIEVLTSCDIISEGTDIPVVNTAILLRPTASVGLYLQQCGRVLRMFEGKKNAIILDHVGNCIRHGLVDEVREWSLNGIKKREKKTAGEPQLKIKRCIKCFAMFYAHLTHCPQCGTICKSNGREIAQIDGELSLVDKQIMERARIVNHREQGRARSLEDLLAVARQRGYKPQWAHIIYNTRHRRGTVTV